MKKKVLSALLAVAMFVGIAVPAFAASSSVEGDPDAVTKIEFAKSSYDVKEGDTLNLMKEVTAFVGTKASVLAENAGLTFSIVGNSAVITVDETTGEVTALEKTGTATVMATSQDGKISGKTTIKCVAKPFIKASGFTFDADKEIPVDVVASADGTVPSFKVTIATAVASDSNPSIPTLTIGSKTIEGAQVAASADAEAIAAAFSGKKITIDGVEFTATVASAVVTFTGAKKTVTVPTTGATITASPALKTAGTATISDAVNGKAPKTEAINAEDTEIKIVATPKDATFSNQQKEAISEVAKNITSFAGVPATWNAEDLKWVLSDKAKDAGESDKVVVDLTKAFPTYSEDNNSTAKISVKREMTFKTVDAKVASAVSIPGTATLEVGEKMTLKPVFSSHNQTPSWSWEQNVYGNESVYDYAVVEADDDNNGVVTAVAVGTNKITVTMGAKSATCIVKVVEKGTKSNVVAAPSVTTATLEVGGTQYVTIKNAKDDAKYTFEIDNDNATIVAGTNAVKIFAKKIGTAKVTCYEDGAEIGTITVTVKAASTTTPSKPGSTNNPQTGDSIFAGLF